MKIIKSLEQYVKADKDVVIFLAGSCSPSKKWRNEVIKFLEKIEEDKVLSLENLVIIDPYREDWKNMENSDDSFKEQIEWEVSMLDQTDVFACYFDKDGDGGISMFELGRALSLFKGKFANFNLNFRIIVSSHPDYKYAKNLRFELDAITKKWKAGILLNDREKGLSQHSSKILESYVKFSK